MSIRIVTDSTCDLPEEIVHRYAINVIPLTINVGDQSFLDGVNLTLRVCKSLTSRFYRVLTVEFGNL